MARWLDELKHGLGRTIERGLSCSVEDRMHELEQRTSALEKEQHHMAKTIADLDAGIAALGTILTKFGLDFTAAIAALQAKAANGLDFTPEVTTLNNLATTLTNLDTTAVAQNPTPVVLTAAPTSVALSTIGQTATVNITGGTSATKLVAVSSAPTVATVVPGSGAGNFTVTAVGPGTAALTFTDSSNNAIVVQVTTTAAATALTSVPATVASTGLGTTSTITISGGAGPTGLTAVSSSPAIASVAPGATPGTFIVTEVTVGSATLTVTDSANNRLAIQVTNS